jgi:hypothetical protein
MQGVYVRKRLKKQRASPLPITDIMTMSIELTLLRSATREDGAVCGRCLYNCTDGSVNVRDEMHGMQVD